MIPNSVGGGHLISLRNGLWYSRNRGETPQVHSQFRERRRSVSRLRVQPEGDRLISPLQGTRRDRNGMIYSFGLRRYLANRRVERRLIRQEMVSSALTPRGGSESAAPGC